jgi:NADPH:quinone reductase-like Zn-dependent oxidoreductase
MRAVTLPSYGDAAVLTLADVEDPVAGPGEVLLEVAATAVNRADLLQRMGFYEPPPGASRYPGLECSGRIAALGEGVAGWSVGDEVCAAAALRRRLRRQGGRACGEAATIRSACPCRGGGLPEVAWSVWSCVHARCAPDR